MPHAALMVALTPHMSRLSKLIEEHIDENPGPNSAPGSLQRASPAGSSSFNNNTNSGALVVPSTVAGTDSSPSRVSFSVEKKSPKFSAGPQTICSLNAEVVIRGILPDTDDEEFEQLMWSRRFKVGKASKDGETINEHRVCTVEVPEEIFEYAELQRNGRRRNSSHNNNTSAPFEVAPLKTNQGRIQPKKADLFNIDYQKQQNGEYGGVEDLPDDCTFHLICTLEIIKDSRQQQEPPKILRTGIYEVELDPAAMMLGNSTLLPVEMFGPFIQEQGDAVDIVAFASVFAVIGDDVAAATHGDDANPSLISSVVALSMAAQFEHLVFNVFRPELFLYRHGLQMALLEQKNKQSEKFNRKLQKYQQRQQQQPRYDDEDDHYDEQQGDDDHYDQQQRQLPGLYPSRKQQQQQQPRYNPNNDDEDDYENGHHQRRQQQQQPHHLSPHPARPHNNNNNSNQHYEDRAREQQQRQQKQRNNNNGANNNNGERAPRINLTGTYKQNDPALLAARRRQQLEEDERNQNQNQQRNPSGRTSSRSNNNNSNMNYDQQPARRNGSRGRYDREEDVESTASDYDRAYARNAPGTGGRNSSRQQQQQPAPYSAVPQQQQQRTSSNSRQPSHSSNRGTPRQQQQQQRPSSSRSNPPSAAAAPSTNSYQQPPRPQQQEDPEQRRKANAMNNLLRRTSNSSSPNYQQQQQQRQQPVDDRRSRRGLPRHNQNDDEDW